VICPLPITGYFKPHSTCTDTLFSQFSAAVVHHEANNHGRRKGGRKRRAGGQLPPCPCSCPSRQPLGKNLMVIKCLLVTIHMLRC